MKNQIIKMLNKFYALTFVSIVISGCAPYLKTGSKFNPEIDCNEFIDFQFDKFQVEMKHPNRTTESIFHVVQTNRTGILDLLKANQEKFESINRIEINVGVNGVGKFILNFLPDTIEKDSAFNSNVIKMSKNFRLDSIPNYFAFAKIKIVINDLTDIDLVDSVQFYPERSRKSIGCVISPNLKYIKYAYDRHLRNDGNFSGKAVVQFAIDEHGNIIFARFIEKTINNKSFEDELLGLIKSWKFPAIQNPKNATEVIYPFIFNQ